MLRFKGLIFDKDGTLFHFQESWGSWLDEVLNDICEKSISKKAADDGNGDLFISELIKKD